MNLLERYFPWGCLVLACAGLIVMVLPPTDPPGAARLYDFASLPVMHDGRVKPLDSAARQILLVISNKQSFGEQRGPQGPAIRWLLDVMAFPWSADTDMAAWKHKVLRIDNVDVLRTFGLEPRPQYFKYSPQELAGKIETLQQEILRIGELREAGRQLDLYDTKIMELADRYRMFLQIARGADPTVIAPVGNYPEWVSVHDAQTDSRLSSRQDPAAAAFVGILAAHGKGDAAGFNRALAAYRELVESKMPDQAWWAGLEAWFNHAELFHVCMGLYWVAVLFGCLAWLGWEGPLTRAAVLLTGLALAVHTTALVTRMYLQGRPPVTNLYSTAIFIGWGCVVLGLLLEWMYANGIGTVAGALVAALTMHLAPVLGGTTDTMGNLVAVLNTQFWLATHVTIINIGYAATFMAGILGCLYVIRGVFSASLDRPAMKTFGRMIYGVTCFAIFCSFTGTVLGGIWADQSWGRFWGWDPKENGALLIVLMNAIVLHARWCGWVQERGMALLSILSNLIVGWSWFGTNQLGVGLHAYGFSNELAQILVWFWGSQLLLAGLGSLPLRYWRSLSATRQSPELPRDGRSRRMPRPMPADVMLKS